MDKTADRDKRVDLTADRDTADRDKADNNNKQECSDRVELVVLLV